MKNDLKVIFLDFDGVINDYTSHEYINKKNVEILKYIIDKSNAKIVVTSSNKYGFQYNGIKDWKKTNFYRIYGEKLSELGIDIYDFTPLIDCNREKEIDDYLKNNKDIKQFLILDDDYIIENYKNHEIYIDLQCGLQHKHIEPALKILNGELNFYYDHYEVDETAESRVIRMNQKIKQLKNDEQMEL